jgi:hypothetical protein
VIAIYEPEAVGGTKPEPVEPVFVEPVLSGGRVGQSVTSNDQTISCGLEDIPSFPCIREAGTVTV